LAAYSAASSRGGRPAAFAERIATLVAKSPFAESFGRSSSTGEPRASLIRAVRRSTTPEAGSRFTGLVSSSPMDDEQERQLNIHMEPQHLAGVYANFANITFSDYEFTLTFARIDHEVEEGDVPGVVVARVNMSQQFATELLAALQDAHSKYLTVKGIQSLPETDR
jgi:hypothetical protein